MLAKWEVVNNEIVFTIKANRFLRNMVRAITGTILDVGLSKIEANEVAKRRFFSLRFTSQCSLILEIWLCSFLKILRVSPFGLSLTLLRVFHHLGRKH